MSGKTLIERCQRIATWDKPTVAVFHAPFRGYEFVRFGKGETAREIWRKARADYAGRFTMPDYDAKLVKAVCIVDVRTSTIWQ